MVASAADLAEAGSIVIRLPNVGAFNSQGAAGLQFDHFIEYDYAQDFLSPSDQGSFTVDGDELSDQDRASIIPGAKVEVSIDGNVQTIGFIDDVRPHGSRESGSLITITFRDWLAPMVDAQVNPQTRFTSAMTLADLVLAVFQPLGVTKFAIDNLANRNAITGRKYGPKSSKKGRPLKSYVLHQIKPYPNEGAFAFASRVAQRFGLWIWPAVDGETLVVGQPDYTQDPSYAIHHKVDASRTANNVLDYDVTKSRKDQPSVILGWAGSAGGEFAKAKIRAGIINPLITNGIDLVQPITSRYPDIAFTTPDFVFPPAGNFIPIPDSAPRPLYLPDPESHTPEQLQAFLRRELSLRMRKALTSRYTFEGHKLGGVPLCVDTIATVEDDRADWHGPLWCIGRRFHKAAGSTGTKTDTEWIMPGTLQF